MIIPYLGKLYKLFVYKKPTVRLPAFVYTVSVASVPNFVITFIGTSLKTLMHSTTLRITISSYSEKDVS